MANIEIFKNEEFGEIRTLLINGEPWFVGKDVAAAMCEKAGLDTYKIINAVNNEKIR